MRVLGLGSVAMVTWLAGIGVPASADDQGAAAVQVQEPIRQPVWTQNRAKSWTSDHRTWVQRGGYQGVRVPDDQFTLNFGEAHRFRIDNLPCRTVKNEASFQYNGYWMSVVDPWPETWADGWYENDDVYVRYDNGYYLHNSRYPDVALSLQLSN